MSRVLVDSALEVGVRRFVQESIAFLYEDNGEHWIDEDGPIEALANLMSATVAEANVAAGDGGGIGGRGIALRRLLRA